MIHRLPELGSPRVSCSTASLYQWPLAIALGMIRDAGFDGAEFVVSPEALARGLAWVEQAFARADLAALSYHPPLYPFPGWPARHQLAAMLRTAQGARRLGCEVAVIHAPRSRSLATPRARRYVAALDMTRALAGGCGVAIGLETTQRPWNGKPPLLFDDLGYFLRFADEHEVGVTLDTSHALANGEDPLDALYTVGPRLVNIHFSDCRLTPPGQKPHTHLFPGAGDHPGVLARFLRALVRQEYSGLVTIEISPLELGVLSRAAIERRLSAACAFARAALAAPTSASAQPSA